MKTKTHIIGPLAILLFYALFSGCSKDTPSYYPIRFYVDQISSYYGFSYVEGHFAVAENVKLESVGICWCEDNKPYAFEYDENGEELNPSIEGFYYPNGNGNYQYLGVLVEGLEPGHKYNARFYAIIKFYSKDNDEWIPHTFYGDLFMLDASSY